jgi:hypothetical protein
MNRSETDALGFDKVIRNDRILDFVLTLVVDQENAFCRWPNGLEPIAANCETGRLIRWKIWVVENSAGPLRVPAVV